MQLSNPVYRGAIARFGNSQGIRIPQDILRQANLYEDFSEVPGGKIMVDLIVDSDSITIRRSSNQKTKWSQAKQSEACRKFLAAIDKYGDNEPLPENFAEIYRYKSTPLDKSLFEGLEDD